MKKGNPDIRNKVVEALQKGLGRLYAVKAAGIDYQTFLNWMNSEHRNHDVVFFEAIKKAEFEGLQKIKETCVNIIIRAASGTKGEDGKYTEKPIWQAAAWMLERRFGNEFALNKEIEPEDKNVTAEFIDE